MIDLVPLRRLRRWLVGFAALASLGGCVGQAAPVAPQVAPAYGYVCHAGFYTCQLGAQLPVGTQCTCPGLGAPSYGTVQ